MPLDQVKPQPKQFSIKKAFGYRRAWGIHAYLATRPTLFYALLNILGRNQAGTINQDTAMVISAAGGCGNTYALDAARLNLPDRHFGSHHHLPIEVIQASRHQVPCLVLIRHPLDAICSVASRGAYQYSPGGLEWAIKDYILFYESIADLSEHFVPATFTEVVTDYVAVIDKLNAKFGTHFVVPPNDSDEAQSIVNKNKWEEQNRFRPKEHIRDALFSDYFTQSRNAAIATYKKFCTMHGLQMTSGPAAPDSN